MDNDVALPAELKPPPTALTRLPDEPGQVILARE